MRDTQDKYQVRVDNFSDFDLQVFSGPTAKDAMDKLAVWIKPVLRDLIELEFGGQMGSEEAQRAVASLDAINPNLCVGDMAWNIRYALNRLKAYGVSIWLYRRTEKKYGEHQRTCQF